MMTSATPAIAPRMAGTGSEEAAWVSSCVAAASRGALPCASKPRSIAKGSCAGALAAMSSAGALRGGVEDMHVCTGCLLQQRCGAVL